MLHHFRKYLSAIVVGSILSVIASLAVADTTLDQAKALLEAGKAQAAYALLSAEEPARAGNVDFDLLLGIAAVETGKNTNAVFALERVLAMQPNHARARAEIARAYYALGETGTARREFQAVRSQAVPDEVRRTIDHFLAAIDRLDTAGKTVIRGYAELTYGHDTNVNAGPAGSQVAVPAFGGAIFNLGASGTELEDSFTTAAAGISLRSPLGKDFDLLANLSGNKRINGTYDIYDTGGSEGNIGVAYTRAQDIFTVGYQLGSLYVDNDRHRDNSGFTAQWQRNFNSRNQGSLFLQHGWLRYPGQRARDADRTVAGVNYAHALADRKSVVYGGLYAGEENETGQNVPHLGHRLWGLRVGGQHQLKSDIALFANFSHENRHYGGPDPFFLVTRDDDQTSLGIGIVWDATPLWRVTSQFAHVRNSSNVPINAYTRDMISISVRRSF